MTKIFHKWHLHNTLTIHHKRKKGKILYKKIKKNYYGTLLRIKSDIMLQSIISIHMQNQLRKDQSPTDSVVQCHRHTLNGSQITIVPPAIPPPPPLATSCRTLLQINRQIVHIYYIKKKR